ncbi:MAG: hypothetical protein QF415_10345 [Candidatus Undinarchaeales archaeon]|nr:hypothetical protein [Candidatus Undinarchaeales archaeon]MDP7494408.1 hypothetical protein [Candidatus Undinarchaeales archaeon]
MGRDGATEGNHDGRPSVAHGRCRTSLLQDVVRSLPHERPPDTGYALRPPAG